MHINLENMLSRAEGIYKLLIEKADELPDCVRLILGLQPLNLHVWVPPPVPQLGGQSDERERDSPSARRSQSSPQPGAGNQSGAGEAGTSGSRRPTSPGSDSERDSSIEAIPNGTEVEDSFEKAITSQYF